jgi:hypothetical protein
LAGAIERDPGSAAVSELIGGCAARVAAADPGGVPLFAGLCCTHYGYVGDRIAAALGAALRRPVQLLNPNDRMVGELVIPAAAGGAGEGDGLGANRMDGGANDPGGVSVEVISKVRLDEVARNAVAGLVEHVSPATAQALLSYSLVPDLF